MRIKAVASLLLLAAVAAATASDTLAAPLSLRECVLQAIEHSPELSSGHHLSEASNAYLKRARGSTLPYFSSQLQGYEVNGTPVSAWYPLGLFQPENGAFNAPGSQNAHWAAVGLEQIGVAFPLFFQGSIMGLNNPPVVAMARTSSDQQSIANLITEQKVIFNVVTDYVYATEYQVQAATAETMAELAKQQLAIVQAQVKLGLKLPQQIEIADSQVESANETSRAAIAGKYQFEEDLATLIGRKGSELQVENVQLPLSRLVPLNRFLDEVMPAHPALRAQQTKVELARQQLRVDEANFWPRATLFNNLSSAQDLEYFNGSRAHPRPVSFLSYLTVDIPLYDFGERRAASQGRTFSRERMMSARWICRFGRR
jgi:outer membrane protein TolC